MLVFLGMFTCIKRTAPDIPTGQAMFFRSLFALPPILAWLVWRNRSWRGLRARLATRRPAAHLSRGLCGSAGMGLGFLAVGILPLSEAVAIGYAAPLLVTVFAALFLGERIRAYRITAVLVGFTGVLLVLAPRLFAGSEAATLDGELARRLELVGASAALCAAVFAALAQVFTRRLVATESTAAVVFWFSVCSATLSLCTVSFGWAWPTIGQGALLIGAGLLGGVGQILLTSSYRHAELAVIAPFEYTSMLFSLAIGWFVFAEVPTPIVLVGAMMVIGAGLSILWREHRLGIERRKARALVPPQG